MSAWNHDTFVIGKNCRERQLALGRAMSSISDYGKTLCEYFQSGITCKDNEECIPVDKSHRSRKRGVLREDVVKNVTYTKNEKDVRSEVGKGISQAKISHEAKRKEIKVLLYLLGSFLKNF